MRGLNYERRPEQGPCACPVAIDDPEPGPQNHNHPHTLAEHERESCSGHPACGGCYDCIIAQWAHYEYLARVEERARRDLATGSGCSQFADVEAYPGVCTTCGNRPHLCPYEVLKACQAAPVLAKDP